MQLINIPERKRQALLAYLNRHKATLTFEAKRSSDVWDRQVANELLIEVEDQISILESASPVELPQAPVRPAPRRKTQTA